MQNSKQKKTIQKKPWIQLQPIEMFPVYLEYDQKRFLFTLEMKTLQPLSPHIYTPIKGLEADGAFTLTSHS